MARTGVRDRVHTARVERPAPGSKLWLGSAAVPVTRGIDTTLDVVIVAFALFTILYHVAIVLDLHVTTTVIMWIVATAAAVVCARTFARPVNAVPDDNPHDVLVEPFPSFATASLVIGGLAALVVGTTVLDDARWWLFDIAAVA